MGLRVEYSDWNTLPTIGAIVGQREMSFRHGEVFRYDGYGALDARFVDADPGDPHARYMEHLSVVGQRAGELPAEIELQGGACERVQFTPDQDGPGSRLTAHGVNPVHSVKDLPIRQDDPARPGSARIKIDLPAAGEIAFLMAYHWAEQDDDLDFYLMYDADRDGDFVYPDERVDELKGGGMGFIARTPLPAGDYQLWVHARQVRGAASTVDYDVVMVAGAGLRLEELPANLEAGVDYTVELCADPVAGAQPLLGMMTFALADGLRVARVPVRVAPGGVVPPAAIFFPALRNRGLSTE